MYTCRTRQHEVFISDNSLESGYALGLWPSDTVSYGGLFPLRCYALFATNHVFGNDDGFSLHEVRGFYSQSLLSAFARVTCLINRLSRYIGASTPSQLRHGSVLCRPGRTIERPSGSSTRFRAGMATSVTDQPDVQGDSAQRPAAVVRRRGKRGAPTKGSKKRPIECQTTQRMRPLPDYRWGAFEPSPPQIIRGVLHVAVSKTEHKPVPGRLLRDNCPCSQCRNPETAQRKVNVFRMRPEQLRVEEAKFVDSSQNEVEVTFADGHRGVFLTKALALRRAEQSARFRYEPVPVRTWTANIHQKPPHVPYGDLATNAGMAGLLHQIAQYGFAFVHDMPATPEATEELLTSIGPIRNTHYGGFYDFTSDLSSKDTAYTAEALEPHTDNTYFTEPSGLQALHMLSHTDGSGGKSSLVDGFGAAAQLYAIDQEAYRTLSMTSVHAHASGNEGISIQPAYSFPVLNHQPNLETLMQVRWNNADRAGIAANVQDVDRWYEAAAKFDALLNLPHNQYSFQLEPGSTLIINNWRVLHGRSAFTGMRRMCGGYSRFRKDLCRLMTNLVD